MRSEKYQIEVDDYERRALLGMLADRRNQCLETNKPTEDVNTLLERALDAKPKSKKRDRDRDER